MKKFSLLLCLLALSFSMFAGVSVKTDKRGTFIVSAGKKIPVPAINGSL